MMQLFSPLLMTVPSLHTLHTLHRRAFTAFYFVHVRMLVDTAGLNDVAASQSLMCVHRDGLDIDCASITADIWLTPCERQNFGTLLFWP
jgi:hypothetical protein